jgi:hypothetical protein
MKRFIITIIAFVFFCSPILAADNCKTEIPAIIEKLKQSTKILDEKKKEFSLHLEEALKLCQAGDLEGSEKKMRKIENQFFREALEEQQTFYGN